ncbi:MAG: hypothetical protein WC393_02090 [Candidatus Nanoarchaeia archaeon]|jgi:hypothetical protein
MMESKNPLKEFYDDLLKDELHKKIVSLIIDEKSEEEIINILLNEEK